MSPGGPDPAPAVPGPDPQPIARQDANGDPYTPFVTTRLELVWVRDAPADLVCFWFGPARTYRLTPAAYAHLFHAADLKAEADPGTAAELVAALDAIYAALVTRYDPADVHPWSPTTPPLPSPPTLPKIDGKLPPLPRSERRESAPPAKASAPAEVRPKGKKKSPSRARLAAGDAIATGGQSAGMFDGLRPAQAGE